MPKSQPASSNMGSAARNRSNAMALAARSTSCRYTPCAMRQIRRPVDVLAKNSSMRSRAIL
jgi:hypothetical protein